MRIYSTDPYGNEMADMIDAYYFHFTIGRINEQTEWLKTSNKTVQSVLAHIDILLMLARKFPMTAGMLIKQRNVNEWKNVFYEWYSRVESKIPKKFRDGIKENADELFAELEKYEDKLDGII